MLLGGLLSTTVADADLGGPYVTHTTDDHFILTTNSEGSEKEIRDNLASEEKPKDVEAKDPETEEAERISKAASDLGKKGAEAAAAKRAEKAEQAAEEKEAKADEEDKPEEKPLGKPRDDPRARIKQLADREKEARQELELQREERRKLEARLADLEKARTAPQPDTTKPAPSDKPRQDQYGTYEEFVEATSRWSAKQEFEALAKTQRQEAQARYMAATYAQKLEGDFQKFMERRDAAVKADPDFFSKISTEVQNLKPSFMLEPGERATQHNAIADELFSSEKAPALMLHLSEHPDDLQRIATLQTPRDIAREMAKLEVRLDAATTATSSKTETSKAKPPVRPVTTSSTAASSDLDEDAPFEEHYKTMNARDRARRRA